MAHGVSVPGHAAHALSFPGSVANRVGGQNTAAASLPARPLRRPCAGDAGSRITSATRRASPCGPTTGLHRPAWRRRGPPRRRGRSMRRRAGLPPGPAPEAGRPFARAAALRARRQGRSWRRSHAVWQDGRPSAEQHETASCASTRPPESSADAAGPYRAHPSRPARLASTTGLSRRPSSGGRGFPAPGTPCRPPRPPGYGSRRRPARRFRPRPRSRSLPHKGGAGMARRQVTRGTRQCTRTRRPRTATRSRAAGCRWFPDAAAPGRPSPSPPGGAAPAAWRPG